MRQEGREAHGVGGLDGAVWALLTCGAGSVLWGAILHIGGCLSASRGLCPLDANSTPIPQLGPLKTSLDIAQRPLGCETTSG